MFDVWGPALTGVGPPPDGLAADRQLAIRPSMIKPLTDNVGKISVSEERLLQSMKSGHVSRQRGFAVLMELERRGGIRLESNKQKQAGVENPAYLFSRHLLLKERAE